MITSARGGVKQLHKGDRMLYWISRLTAAWAMAIISIDATDWISFFLPADSLWLKTKDCSRSHTVITCSAAGLGHDIV